MNVLDLFLQANFLVKISMLILIILSIISWSVIFNRIYVLKLTKYKFKKFENKFWSGIELPNLYQEITTRRKRLSGIEHVFYEGFKEFSKLYQIKYGLPEKISNRTSRVMQNTIHIELEELTHYIPLIGIIGSTSPYIGLFGTVLGIIRVFFELSKTANVYNQNIHIQIIAPGVAEALISTAIGLFVAIPAVIAFNYLTAQIGNLDQNYNNFSEEFLAILYHQTCFDFNHEMNKKNKDEKNTK